jgi:hypothetical protein
VSNGRGSGKHSFWEVSSGRVALANRGGTPAITRALDSGLTYRQVQMTSKHRNPKTVMRYEHGRENLDQSAVNFLRYEGD